MGNARCNESHFSRGVRARTAGSVQIPPLFGLSGRELLCKKAGHISDRVVLKKKDIEDGCYIFSRNRGNKVMTKLLAFLGDIHFSRLLLHDKNTTR